MRSETLKTVVEDERRCLERIKVGYRNFSDFTSCHGFSELYHAKSLFWKTFWFFCLCAAFGLTTYQVHSAITEYLGQSSTTIIQPAKSSEIVYPPIKLCYMHWVYWVDFDKGYKMNFTKESILLALSYMGSIYAVDKFNTTEALNNFTETLKLNNLTTITEFYKAIAKAAPLYSVEDEYFDDYQQNGGPIFNKTEIMTYPLNHQYLTFFCYIQDGYETIKYIKEKMKSTEFKSNMNIINFEIADEANSTISSGFSTEEYNAYMADYLDWKTSQYCTFEPYETNIKYDYTSFFVPMIIFPDGYSDIGTMLVKETDEYSFTIKASAHKWKNTKANPCNISIRSVMSDTSCFKIACAENDFYGPLNKSAFYKLHLVGKDVPQNLYRYSIFFLPEPFKTDSTNETMTTLNIQPTTLKSTYGSTSLLSRRQSLSSFSSEISPTISTSPKVDCSNLCMLGCERWNFDVTASSSSIYSSTTQFSTKVRTNIRIIYPIDGDVLIMTEVDSQTWESFVGNVGGLLGIWTGASILSFLQMFYLLCCAECSCCETIPIWHHQNVATIQRRRKKQIMIKVEPNKS